MCALLPIAFAFPTAAVAAPAPTTIPDVSLPAPPLSFEATIEPDTSFEGTLGISGSGIRRGVVTVEVAADREYLVTLSIDGSETLSRGINTVEAAWGCLQTSSCGGRLRYRIDPLRPVLSSETIQIRVRAEARDERFGTDAGVEVVPEASGLVAPAKLIVSSEQVTLDESDPVGAVIIDWDLEAPPDDWELLVLTDPAIAPAADPLLANGSPQSNTIGVVATSDEPCPDDRCVGRSVLRLGPAFAPEVRELTAYAVLRIADPTDIGAPSVVVRSAPATTATGSLVLDDATPDALIPVFVNAGARQRLDVYAFVRVDEVAGDLFEPVSIALDQPGATRSWRTGYARLSERRPDGLANYELALASRPAFRGAATVTATWTVVAVATPYEDVPVATAVEIRAGDPRRVVFTEGEPGDPTLPLESNGWDWVWPIGLSALLLLAAAAAAVTIWRRGIRVHQAED